MSGRPARTPADAIAEFDQQMAAVVHETAKLAQGFLEDLDGDEVAAVDALAAFYIAELPHEAMAAAMAMLAVRLCREADSRA